MTYTSTVRYIKDPDLFTGGKIEFTPLSTPRQQVDPESPVYARAARDFIIPDDIKRYATPILTHRVILQPEYWMSRSVGDDVIRDALEKTPVPVVK